MGLGLTRRTDQKSAVAGAVSCPASRGTRGVSLNWLQKLRRARLQTPTTLNTTEGLQYRS